MLSRLKQLHSDIEACIAEIAELTDGVSLDTAAIAAARLRLSKASAARTKHVVDEIYRFLNDRADAGLRKDLDDLSAGLLKNRLISSRHVTEWSTADIVADWRGYQAASVQIRKMMRQRIADERRILYPALARYPYGGHR